MMRRISAALSGAVLVFFAEPRDAQAAPVLHIQWPTVPGCPASPVVVQHARTAIAQAKNVDDVLAIAEVTPPASQGGPWQLHVRTRTIRGGGERTLEGASCDALARAAGLLVALAALRTRSPAPDEHMDEIAPEPDRVDELEAFVAPLSPPAATEPVPEPRAAERATSSDARFVPSAGIGVAVGLLPRIGVGPNVTLGYEASWLRVRLGFRALIPQEEARAEGLGAELTSFGATGEACGRLPLLDRFLDRLRTKAHACVGAAVDDIRASGFGGPQTFDVHRTAMMVFGGVAAEWALGSMYRVGVDVRAGGSPVRPRFLVDSVRAGERELHRPSALRAEGTLMFGLVF